VVICLERGADLHMAQLMPLIGFTCLVPAHLGSPGQRAVKRVWVWVCVCVRCNKDVVRNVCVVKTQTRHFQLLGFQQNVVHTISLH